MDLHGINLSGSAFVGWPVDLSGTNLDGATLQRTSFQQAELAGATFNNVQAAGAVFRGAHLAAHGTQPAATFAGSQTNLQGADFIEADVSGASFSSADLSIDPSGTKTAFDRALAVDTDFTGVRAIKASFVGAHIYGNGGAFDAADDLSGVDFSDALLASDVTVTGGFDLTSAPLSGAIFDGAQCIACDFTGATLDGASFVGAYLPGVKLSNATLKGTNLDSAWLYCGDLQNSACPTASDASAAAARAEQPSTTGAQRLQSGQTSAGPRPASKPAVLAQASPSPSPRTAASPASGTTWSWALDLGFNEVYGPVPFSYTDLTGVPLADLAYCPDGDPPDQNNNCAGDAMLPASAMITPPIPCSTPSGQPDGRGAVAGGACPTRTTTLFDATSIGKPLAVVAASPPAWATTFTARGYYVGLDDGTVRLVGDGAQQVFAGQAGQPCASPAAPCGDGGPAASAQLGSPSGLAVGPDGALYVADPTLHRVRRIDAGDQTITTVAGTGQACSQTDTACGDGGPASAALLGGPDGVWVDPTGVLWIADDTRGLREVDADGTISSVGFTPGAYTVRDVVGDSSGNLYATTNHPDYLFLVTPPAPVAPVTTCQQLALAPGSLIQTDDSVEIDIVDLSCQRHHVPDLVTLAQIQATYNAGLVMTLSATDWQAIPASAAIPGASTDPIGFAQAMWAIFEPVCARLVLAPGDLIRASGPEIDILTPSCQRQHVSDPATLKLIEQTYNLGITPVPDSDWQEIVGGAAIPSASTDLPGFGQAMWAIFQPECARLTLAPGALIQATGPEVDILTPSCERQHVPDLATEQQIEQTYNVSVALLSQTEWQAIPAGSAIPSASTDLADWAQAMEQIFGSACIQLSLKSGNLIQASGGSEIDIVGETCQRQHVPNPDTLFVIQYTYNPPFTTLSELHWQQIPAGPDIPDAGQDTLGFWDVMKIIFGTSPPWTTTTRALTPPASPNTGGRARPVEHRQAAPVVGGQATPVVGTGTSGYNGTVDMYCNLLSATQVQVDTPAGVSVRADGAILFADTGNNIVRAYVPVDGTVVDEAGLLDTADCPPTAPPLSGFNADGQWADKTELAGPRAVTASVEADPVFVVADTANTRVRVLGPIPLDDSTVRAERTSAAPPPTATPAVSSTPTATPSVPASPTPTPATPTSGTPTPTATGRADPSATPTPSSTPAAPRTTATPRTPSPRATATPIPTRPSATPGSRPTQPAATPHAQAL
ncbi:MAG TPA: pentapeptide repeat-containing protein [Chloroflexota bacterium]